MRPWVHEQMFRSTGLSKALLYHRVQAAVVAEWSSYRIVAGLVTSSSAVPVKTRHVGERCTFNLSRVQKSSRWCVGAAQVLSTLLDHSSKLRVPSPKALV
ncbi:hypothetical protein TNCV_3819931 [Trichonephila clavipes]|uniref:Uncharacterized protein n=1 Tax=Trichonephila clavipes TaxID=2585209 RepID=A0A8X6R2M7_TRICX|nr:hypothetical protein TNCV_3819931 [Trichonephila clavipes]